MTNKGNSAFTDGSSLIRSGTPWLGRLLLPELGVLLLIFVVLYYYRLANYYPLIDDEVAAVRTSPEIWLSQGRWGAYLFELLVLPNPVLLSCPFFCSVFSSR
ncbi:MAG: hypothetical protein RBT39_17055 [Azoarcus sp.]|jgi:hypothetical protein|nr:hypothetical protein [Azoarcus sp.]